MSRSLAFSLLLLAGTARGAELPVCMYGLNSPADLAVIKGAGFNCFQTYDQDPARLSALAARAAELGLGMVAMPQKVMASPYSEAAKNWPVLAWYLYDEPEVRRRPAGELLELDRKVKAWSPAQKTCFVMGEGIAAFTYAAAADILMVDWYPVPHLPLGSVGEAVTMLKQAARLLDAKRPEKPVWAVLQAFDWIHERQRRTPRVGGFPSFEQVRYMTYLSLMRGASGVFYFQWNQHGGKKLEDYPERWETYRRMAAELKELGPVLAEGARGATLAGLPEGAESFSVSRGGETLLLVLNHTGRNLPFDPFLVEGWTPLFEAGPPPLKLPPYRVLILRKTGA